MSFKSLLGALLGVGGSWLGFGTLILIQIWSLVFDAPTFKILAIYLDFEGARNLYFLLFLIWGFRGCMRFLTEIGQLDPYLDIVTGL